MTDSSSPSVSSQEESSVAKDLAWMTDRLNDPAECLNFFLKLGAGSHSNVYSQAVSSLRTAFDHAEAVNSGGCTNSLSTPLVASVALRLSSVVRPEDDKHDQERSPADSDNPISPHVKLYPVLAMLCDPGIENRKQLYSIFKLIVVTAATVATTSADNTLVRRAAVSVREAFQKPSPSRQKSVTGKSLSWRQINYLEPFLRGQNSMYDLLENLKELKSYGSDTQKASWVAVAKSVSSLNTLLLKSALSSSTRFEPVSISSLAMSMDLEPTVSEELSVFLPVSESSIDHGGAANQFRIEAGEPSDSVTLIEADVSEHLPEDVTEDLSDYLVSRSLGKLRRAYYVKSYSKVLFNPIERAWLSNHIQERLSSSAFDAGDFLVVLSICTALPPAALAELSVGVGGADIDEFGFWKIEILPPQNAANRQGLDESRLNRVTRNIELQLPDLGCQALRSLRLNENPASKLSVALDSSVKELNMLRNQAFQRLRDKHGRRFHSARIESQLRYWIAANTQDVALIDMIFGHGRKGHPVQRYYRQISARKIKKLYSLLSESYFEKP